MSAVDVLIPLAIGLLLVLRPQVFATKSDSPDKIARRSDVLRKIGWVLVAVGVVFAGIFVVS